MVNRNVVNETCNAYLGPEIRRVELQCDGPDEGEGCGGAEFSKHVDSHKCCVVCLGKEGEGEAAERLASSNSKGQF